VVILAACGSVPAPLPAPHGPPARPRCGGPVLALGAPQLQRAYQVTAMLAAGTGGRATTIADIVPWASPWITRDLAVYSRRYHLPPPRLTIINWHHAPTATPGNPEAASWAGEGLADLEMMHALAPAATLIYLETPGTGTPGVWYTQALAWLAAHHPPDVVSYSSGLPENPAIPGSRAGLQAAARAGITVVASTGDTGATQPEPGGKFLYPHPVTAWPASDPLVTAVGGTRLHVDPAGNRTGPDTAFSDVGGWAGGAGRSALFPRPPWQNRVRAVVGDRRGIADIAMDASNCSPAAVFEQPLIPGSGWGTAQGTSISAPLFAALVADAAQLAGHRLGVLGPALYSLHGAADGITDVTSGTDTIPGMAGFTTRPGYDLPTGLGTVGNARQFTAALARATHPAPQGPLPARPRRP
jgi:subtilase family serine protease